MAGKSQKFDVTEHGTKVTKLTAKLTSKAVKYCIGSCQNYIMNLLQNWGEGGGGYLMYKVNAKVGALVRIGM